MTAPGVELVASRSGRRFTASQSVRLGDVLPSGDARLDAVARYLQDIAADDAADAAIDVKFVWLVRRTSLQLRRRPTLGERLELVTWASGSGSRWAERRTTVSVAGNPIIEAASLWVCVDPATMRPSRLPERFWEMYREAIDGRSVSSRLAHPNPPPAPNGGREWPLRVSDLDVMAHVNNAVAWAAVEDELDRLGVSRAVVAAELEYREAMDQGHDPMITSEVDRSTVRVWLTSEGSVLASAEVRLAVESPAGRAPAGPAPAEPPTPRPGA